MSNRLAALQASFQAYLLNQSAHFAQQVQGLTAEFVATRLAIYKEAYTLRLIEILALEFPKLKVLMGARQFETLMQAYLQQYPSQFFSARHIGMFLAQFLATKAKPAWAEMAKFEWALSQVVDAADAPALSMADLIAIPQEAWPSLRFEWHPSVQIIYLQGNTPQQWRAIEDKRKPRPRWQAAKQPSAWAVWRQGLTSFYSELAPAAAAMLMALGEGQDFAELCQGLCEAMPEDEVPSYAMTCLSRWVKEGVISKVQVSELT